MTYIYIIPFKPVETFTIINFWRVVLRRIPYFREEFKTLKVEQAR